ncbi:MAG TPA: prepilin-type N-terminal cleavage/methylation domain-containing protein [Candidatus Nanoarchaeia archaeon]|nr:hypothetical protein [uncultured archaeon]
MIKQLRSHLKDTRGFTLIELLVVIAIIAVLVTIVLVAINPLARIQEAQRRDAQSGVRQVAAAMEACYTTRLGDGTATTDETANVVCDSFGELVAGNFLKQTVAGVTVDSTDTTNATLCAWAVGGGQAFIYKNAFSAGGAAGEVFQSGTTAPADCTDAL